MTARRKRVENGPDEWTFSISKKSVVLLVIAALFMASGHPALQKAGHAVLGIATPVGNIEEIKVATDRNTKQIDSLNAKVDALIVEVETIRMLRDRTVKQ